MWLKSDWTETSKWQHYGRSQFKKEDLKSLLIWVPSKQSLSGKGPRKTNEKDRDSNWLCTIHQACGRMEAPSLATSHFYSWVIFIHPFLNRLPLFHVTLVQSSALKHKSLGLGILWINTDLQLSTPEHALLDTLALSWFLTATANIKHDFSSLLL